MLVESVVLYVLENALGSDETYYDCTLRLLNKIGTGLEGEREGEKTGGGGGGELLDRIENRSW